MGSPFRRRDESWTITPDTLVPTALTSLRWHLGLVLHGNLGAFEPERHPSLTEGAGVEIDGAPLTEPRRLEPGVELQVRADEPGHGGHVGPAGGVMVFGMGPPLRRPPVGHPLSPASADPFSAPC